MRVFMNHYEVNNPKIVAGMIQLIDGAAVVNLNKEEEFLNTEYVVGVTPFVEFADYKYGIDRNSKMRTSFKIISSETTDTAEVFYVAIGGDKYA